MLIAKSCSAWYHTIFQADASGTREEFGFSRRTRFRYGHWSEGTWLWWWLDMLRAIHEPQGFAWLQDHLGEAAVPTASLIPAAGMPPGCNPRCSGNTAREEEPFRNGTRCKAAGWKIPRHGNFFRWWNFLLPAWCCVLILFLKGLKLQTDWIAWIGIPKPNVMMYITGKLPVKRFFHENNRTGPPGLTSPGLNPGCRRIRPSVAQATPCSRPGTRLPEAGFHASAKAPPDFPSP